MPKGYPKDGRPPGRPENLRQNRRAFAKGDGRAQAAGKKGGETTAALREMKQILTERLAAPAAGETRRTVQEALAEALVEYAAGGDMTAYALMLRLIGQYPEERARLTVAGEVPQIVDDIPAAPAEKAEQSPPKAEQSAEKAGRSAQKGGGAGK